MKFSSDFIRLYKSIFSGRQDVHAIRWEKEEKTGYMPAYKVDWSDYNKYKSEGGKFKDYANKEYIPFSDEVLLRHLHGTETVGIYPLLEDNTSYFIVADFDDKNWKESVQRLYSVCTKHEIPSYVERSRSGNGAHLWIFFEDNFPAEQTRKLMFELLREASIISHFDKEPSFDRLFPNQDFHSGKGLGNLIALPLNGKSLKESNSAFLNPSDLEPYRSQYDLIGSFQKLTKVKFRNIYENFFNEKVEDFFKSSFAPNLYVPFNYKIDKYETISRILIHDTHRNSLIINDIENRINRFNKFLILTERKAHVEILNLYLKNKFETIIIHGDDSESNRKSKMEQLKLGHYKIVISTGQYFGEGIDLNNLECLVIAYPFAFEGKLIQYIGRIQHSDNPPVIFDYRDSNIDYFEKMFKQRNRYYKKLSKQVEAE